MPLQNLCFTCSLLCLTGLCAAQPGIRSIGTLPGPQQISHAFAVSADGSKVAGVSSPFGFFEPVLWTESDGLSLMPTPPDTGNFSPDGFSASGTYLFGTHGIVGVGGPIGFVRTEQGGVVSIGDLPGGRNNSWLAHVTDDGVGVGASSYAFNSINAPLFRAVRWSADTGLEALPVPDGDLPISSAYRTLDDGRIFGRSQSGAWLWSEQTGFEMIPDLPGLVDRSNPDATFFTGNPSGPDNQGPVPAYWTPDGGLEYLSLIGEDTFGHVRGMSDDGSIIVGRSQSKSVLWIDQAEPMLIADYAASIGIDLSGVNIIDVFGVSADGTTIVGTAGFSSGGLEGFVLTIPAPASAMLFGVVLLATRRRR